MKNVHILCVRHHIGGDFVLVPFCCCVSSTSTDRLISSCSLSIISARGDRMKQAQVDADELIAAYRLEQQDAFDKKASADGKSIKC
jgi:hypothetical protein